MKKILIIEDDQSLRQNLNDCLLSENYFVETAENGKLGVELARKISPDLIVSDIMMPVMNGYEVLEELQKDETTAEIPFIFLTAKAEIESLRDGMKLGADDYLFKPFKIGDLLESVSVRLTKKEIKEKKFKEMREELTLKIPHELRTPLIPILGYADMINEEDDIEQIKEMVKLIGKSGRLLHGKIEKLINLSDLVANAPFREHLPEHTEMTGELASFFIKKIAGVQNPEERTVIKVEKATVSINEKYLETIINELVENGLKFSQETDKVELIGRLDGKNYFITVNDKGRGMSPTQINSVTAFQKFGENRISEHGLGLGLAVVQKIVELYNGQFIIKSELGKYTICEVKLPIN